MAVVIIGLEIGSHRGVILTLLEATVPALIGAQVVILSSTVHQFKQQEVCLKFVLLIPLIVGLKIFTSTSHLWVTIATMIAIVMVQGLVM